MTTRNPVTDLLAWLKSQEDEVQREIAFLMSGVNPNFGLDYANAGDKDAELKTFYDKIEQHSGDEMSAEGFLVGFRAIFDYAFVRTRGTPEGWDVAKRRMEAFVENASVSDTTEKMLASLPARQEQWISICRAWDTFKAQSLSDKAIAQWGERNLSTRLTKNAASMNRPLAL